MKSHIRYITRDNLEVEKYDTCIEHAINSRIYGYSWYLDCVADDWDVLVLDDYAAVMPLPRRRKYFIEYIYTPAWTQQLGVFSKEVINATSIEAFLRAIPKQFKKAHILFNSQNVFTHPNKSDRENYIIQLKENYQSLRKNYSKKRRQSVRKADTFETSIVESRSHQRLLPLYYESIFNKTSLAKKDMDNLDELLITCYKRNKAFVVEVLDDNVTTVGGAVFLYNDNRVYYLMSALNDRGKEQHAMTLIIDYVIKKYSEKDVIFDFEGSMIPGIASFFRSFGAKNESYYEYKKSLQLF